MQIHLSLPDVTQVEEEYVLEALRSGYIAPLGPHVEEFETRLAERIGVTHAVALSSGTAALHLGLLAVGCGPGTEVVVPSMTFAATANAVIYTGARPVFVDSRTSDGNVDTDLVMTTVDELLAEGRRLSAVVTVDLFGRCADYTRLSPFLAERDLPLVEDAAEALGASHSGQPAGSFGSLGVLSFNGNKIITTSGGGMILTNDHEIAVKARYLSTQARQPVRWYEHTEIGYNYRLSNILAALGIAQLHRLDDIIARRRQIRDLYSTMLADLDGIRILGRSQGDSDLEDNCWLTSIVLEPTIWKRTPDQLTEALLSQGIECRHLWKPLHLQPAFRSYPNRVTGACERLFENGLNLPSGASLSDQNIETVTSALRMALRRTKDDS